MADVSPGEILRTARKRHNATLRELAEQLGVTMGSVSAWERNASLPDGSRWGDVCAAYGLSDEERRLLAELLGILRPAVDAEIAA